MPSTVRRLTLLATLALAACSSPPPPSGVPALGDGTHSLDRVEVVELLGPDVAFDPTDVAVNPERPSELWVTLRLSNGVVVVDEAASAAWSSMTYAGFGNTHFMPRPSALAFGQPGFLATIHEMDQPTQPMTPADFMGPSLWPSDRGLFDAGHASHLDMLHNSPNGVGICWERENAYWVVDGHHGSLTRYDFRADHGPGQEDHSDGIIARYLEGQITYVPDVPAHCVIDHATGILYLTDPANGRIVTVDTASGTRGADLDFRMNYDGGTMYAMEGAAMVPVIDMAALGLAQPSGIALADGMIFVTDRMTSTIAAFDLVTHELVDYLSFASGAFAGIDVDSEGRIYVADLGGSRVLRITARP
jgi:DNA-binding beta-propeller fold protein YncE